METVEGIVLKESDYQEKSKILQILTKEHGLIGVYLKGANSFRSNTFVLSQPITHALFTINYRQGLSSCFKGEVINSFNFLKVTFDKNIYVYHLFELIIKNIEQHHPIPYLFNLLLQVITFMNDFNDINKIKILTIFTELKLLYFFGIAPVLSNCVECGSTVEIANFDISRGGFVCKNCLRNTQGYSITTLQTLYQLYIADIDKINYDIPSKTINELRSFLTEYYSYHLGMTTNSQNFFT